MATFQRILNILWLFVLCGVLLSGYGYQLIKHEEPCPLCLLQRLGMIGVSIGILLNLRFGIRPEHYGLSILSALLGRIVSLRQISLHVCPEFPTFGSPVLGYDLYVWAFIVFTCSVFAAATLLIIYGFSRHKEISPVWGFWEKLSFTLVALLTGANIITTWLDCGFSAC
jgi:hypothetical protein